MENLKKPQARILAYFIRGGTLTVWKAMSKFGTTELRKIVTRLRRKGYIIVGDWCYSHDADRGRVVRYKEYHMVVNPEIAQIRKPMHSKPENLWVLTSLREKDTVRRSNGSSA